MHALRRSLSRLLLLVMLATVFSPSFGWQAVQGMAAHDDGGAMHAVVAEAEHHAAAEAAACDTCPDHDPLACGEARHHCCPGHVLGHLPGSLAGIFPLAVPDGSNPAVDGGSDRFSTRPPEGLERPPRFSAA